MFDERKMICIYLIVFSFLPLIDNKLDLKVIIPWIVCSCLFFIFPFLSLKIEDNFNLMEIYFI